MNRDRINNDNCNNVKFSEQKTSASLLGTGSLPPVSLVSAKKAASGNGLESKGAQLHPEPPCPELLCGKRLTYNTGDCGVGRDQPNQDTKWNVHHDYNSAKIYLPTD